MDSQEIFNLGVVAGTASRLVDLTKDLDRQDLIEIYGEEVAKAILDLREAVAKL